MEPMTALLGAGFLELDGPSSLIMEGPAEILYTSIYITLCLDIGIYTSIYEYIYICACVFVRYIYLDVSLKVCKRMLTGPAAFA